MDEGPRFGTAFRTEFETLLRWRRDVRQFKTDPLPPGLVESLIRASADFAPSVGYSQPWRFVLVEGETARAAIRANFATENQAALADYTGAQGALYARLKLAGLDQAPCHLAVFCDDQTETGHGLGRRTMPQMLSYSVVTAVHTFWLLAQSHGIGVGWVSILNPVRVTTDLAVPTHWHLIAYLCVGYPLTPDSQPELHRAGWEQPDPAAKVLWHR